MAQTQLDWASDMPVTVFSDMIISLGYARHGQLQSGSRTETGLLTVATKLVWAINQFQKAIDKRGLYWQQDNDEKEKERQRREGWRWKSRSMIYPTISNSAASFTGVAFIVDQMSQHKLMWCYAMLGS